ncbi:MAG: hypothetical protein AAF206_12065 [Bacteroidota bacterium]
MDDVAQHFEEMRTRAMINLSHEEAGWMENHEERELISYQKYAFLLKGI